MPRYDRELWRLAGKLAARWPDLAPPPPAIELDLIPLLQARDLARQFGKLQDRHWNVALATSQRRLRAQLLLCHRQLDTLLDQLSQPTCSPPSQRLLYDELLGLLDEFPVVDWNLREETVTVTSEEIELEGLSLGRFRMVLDGREVLQNPYRIEAETPVTPAGRSDVTHPHVMDETLCLGDAEQPLTRALRSGRLGDLFLILQQTLQTYNRSSCYVAISGWNGTRCAVCDDHVRRSDANSCQACSESVCDDCCRACDSCHNATCRVCLESCPRCAGRCCPSCLSSCPACETECCSRCLPFHTEECHATIDPVDESPERPSSSTPSAPAAITV